MLSQFMAENGKRIVLNFKDLANDFKTDGKIQGVIFQIKDVTLPHKHFIFNFDLSGRLLTIELGDQYRNRTIKLLERSFNGSIYIYLKNCNNLKNIDSPVNYYFDYYNEIVVHDNALAQHFIDYAQKLADNILKNHHCIVTANTVHDLTASDILNDFVNQYDYAALTENKLFKKAYPKDITVLPPDVRPDLNPAFGVLQITNGCWVKHKHGPCAFCDAYSKVGYGELTVPEFISHIEAVKKYSGRDWRNKKYFFLSDGDPLKTQIPTVDYFRVIRDYIPQVQGIESFVTTATILSKTPEEWAKLKEMGLTRLYWGVESADDFVLKFLHKPQTNSSLYRAANLLKKSDIAHTVIIMSGLGNFETDNTCHNRHSEKTIEFVNNSGCDDVYVSKFKSIPGTLIHQKITEGILTNTKKTLPEDEHRNIISHLNKRVKGAYGTQFV